MCQKRRKKHLILMKNPPKKQSLKQLPNWVFYYPTAIVMITVSIVSSVLFLLTRNDPPSLPLNPARTPIDCAFITTNVFSITGSRISFNVSSSNFYQYPKSATLELLRLYAKTGKSMSEYTYKTFWDVEGNLTHFFFNVLHPMIGDTTFNLMCSRIPIFHKNISVKELTVFPVGWSRFQQREFTLFDGFDICWYNESIWASSATQTIFDPIISSRNSTISVNITLLSTQQFASAFNIPYNNYQQRNDSIAGPDVLFLDSDPSMGFLKIIDVLIPVFVHTYYTKKDKMPTLVLTKNQDKQIPIIEKIFSGPIKLSEETKMCWSNGAVLSSINGIPHFLNESIYADKPYFSALLHIDFITRLKQEIINDLRFSFIKKKAPKKDLIVLDSDLSEMKHILQLLYPHVTIEVINDKSDIRKTAKLVSKASILVCSNVLTMSYSIFLQPDVSTLVEVLPIGQECVKVGKRWSQITQTKYASIGRDSRKCTSQTLEDYFVNLENLTYPELTQQEIHSVFDKLLDSY